MKFKFLSKAKDHEVCKNVTPTQEDKFVILLNSTMEKLENMEKTMDSWEIEKKVLRNSLVRLYEHSVKLTERLRKYE